MPWPPVQSNKHAYKFIVIFFNECDSDIMSHDRFLKVTMSILGLPILEALPNLNDLLRSWLLSSPTLDLCKSVMVSGNSPHLGKFWLLPLLWKYQKHKVLQHIPVLDFVKYIVIQYHVILYKVYLLTPRTAIILKNCTTILTTVSHTKVMSDILNETHFPIELN